jgi:hypothetical protein
MTRETVIADTPTCRATSWMVGIAFFFGLRAAGRFRARPVADFMAPITPSHHHLMKTLARHSGCVRSDINNRQTS